MQFFESDHKVGLYFFRYTKFLDQKWGTKALIKYEDPKYNFPVRLRAFGNYSFRIIDPRNFFVNVLSTSASYDTTQFHEMMNNRIRHPSPTMKSSLHFFLLILAFFVATKYFAHVLNMNEINT